MIFKKLLKFRTIALIALALLLLPAAGSLADEKSDSAGSGGLSASDMRRLEELKKQEAVDIKTMEEVLENPEEAFKSIKAPEKTLKSIKNSPYSDEVNKAYSACLPGLFLPIDPMSGPPPKSYFRLDRQKMALLRKCMADKGFTKESFDQGGPPPIDDAAFDKNYKEMVDSYKMRDEAMQNLENVLKNASRQGMGAVTPEIQEKFPVPLTTDDQSKVYRFNKKLDEDRYGREDNQEKKE